MANEPYCFLENYHSLYDVRNTNGLCFLPLKERQRGWSNGSAVQELNGLRHPCGSPQQSPEYPIPSSDLHVYQTCSYYIYKHTRRQNSHTQRAISLLKGEEGSYSLQDGGGHYPWGHKMASPPTGHIHKREPWAALSDASQYPGSPKGPDSAKEDPTSSCSLVAPMLKTKPSNVENQEVSQPVVLSG